MQEIFDYQLVTSVEDALELMQTREGTPLLYAGGTDILVKLRANKLATSVLIDIKGIPELNTICETDDEILIGAAVTHSELQNSEIIEKWYPSLCQGVRQIGSVPIRNKATLGGNIQNASPAADGAIVAFALDGMVEVCSPNKRRRIPLNSFFIAPGKTRLDAMEIITTIVLPKRKWDVQNFFKIGKRNALAISVVNGVVALQFDAEDTISDCRIALGAVAATPIRVEKAENMLIGAKLDDQLIQRVAKCVTAEVSPISDIRASAEYRAYMAGTCVKKQLQDFRRNRT